MAKDCEAAHARRAAPDATGPVANADGRRTPAATFVARRVVVDVPATSANLGPGFDCLALALDFHNRFDASIQPDTAGTHSAPRIAVRGAAADTQHIGHDEDNLFVRAFAALCQQMNVAAPRVRARLEVRVPPGRGLGSSATAVVGGLLAANTLLGEPLGADALLELAIRCEPGQHADNVAAALLGGLVVTGVRDGAGRLVSLGLPIPVALRAVLFVPDMPTSTTHSRSLLPPKYSRADATFNTSRVALLLAALQTGRLDLLATAMEDRFHQPYREQIVPALSDLLAAALEAGAHGVCLSGSGPSVLALVTREAEAVRDALAATAYTYGVAGHARIVDLAREGARARTVAEDAVADDAGEPKEGGRGA